MIELKEKFSIEETKKQTQEKKIFAGKYYPGLKLYALDPKLLEVYEVAIVIKKDFHFDDHNKISRQANINPSHPHIWALNIKTASKKFTKKILKHGNSKK
tara:strand:+ start:457 stop:756 length:300 start_codon:yes stop_codon:yes gene_type:complete